MLALKHSIGIPEDDSVIRKAFHFDRNSVCALMAVTPQSSSEYVSPYSKSFSIWAKNDMVPNKGEFFKYSSVAIGYGNSNNMENTGTYIWILYEVVAWNKSFNNTAMDTNWHHYCLTMQTSSSSGQPKVYIDGILKLTGNRQSISTTASACQYTLGNTGSTSTTRAFAGYLTRFCIFNKVLTASEVAADFALGITTPPTNSATQTFLDMTVKGGVVKDKIGTYDMNIIGGATQVSLNSTM